MQNLIKIIATSFITFLVFVGCGDMMEVNIERDKLSAAEFSTTQALERTAEYSYADTAGAGIYVQDSSLVVEDTDFRNNIAAGKGGAVFAKNSQVSMDCPDPQDRCEIYRNSAQQGGAIYLSGVGTQAEAASIANIDFRTNTAHQMYDPAEDPPRGNAIAVAANETNPNSYLTIQDNADYGSIEAGFKYSIWSDWSHWFAFSPYADLAQDGAHIALLTDTGDLQVSVVSNEVHDCSGGSYCNNNEVSEANRLVRCSGYDADNITISDNLGSGEDDYACE